jgi:hypothetical protein
MAHWFDWIGSWMVNSWAGQWFAYCLAFTLGAAAVAFIDDWYRRMKGIRDQASVAALEVLFALRDTRDCRQRH